MHYRDLSRGRGGVVHPDMSRFSLEIFIQKVSGGLITDRRQAQAVILIFVLVCLFVTFLVFEKGVAGPAKDSWSTKENIEAYKKLNER